MEKELKKLLERLEDCKNISEDLDDRLNNLQIDIESNNDEILEIAKKLEEILKPFQLQK